MLSVSHHGLPVGASAARLWRPLRGHARRPLALVQASPRRPEVGVVEVGRLALPEKISQLPEILTAGPNLVGRVEVVEAGVEVGSTAMTTISVEHAEAIQLAVVVAHVVPAPASIRM